MEINEGTVVKIPIKYTESGVGEPVDKGTLTMICRKKLTPETEFKNMICILE